MIIKSRLLTWSPKSQHNMKNFIVFFGLFMGLASAMNIKEFEEKYHEDFANPEDEAKAAEALAEHEAQINKQHEDFIQGKANFDEEINEFADMDDDEFANEKLGEMESPEDEPAARIFGGRKFYLGLIHDEGENTPEEIEELDKIYASIDRETLPESYDSRALGLVTAVKSQGSCGSCVAFATTAVLETNLLKAGAKMDGLDISDQHLVDCAHTSNHNTYYGNGCNGAPGHGYARFYNENGKEMIHENNYPYVMMENNYQCKQASYWHPGYKIEKGLWDYDCSDEEMMKLIYENGAVSTGVGVDTGFSYYSSGVYDTCTSTSTNHAVVIVGWGTENGIDYWIIKNSWGSWWGEQGYIRVKRSTCAARRCVWFKIESAGGVTDPDPTTPKPPEQSSCDMTKIFGGLNGDHTLKLTSHGNYYKAEVTCVEGVCKAKNPDIVDSCHYICGSPTCDHVNDVKCTGGYTDWSCCSETNKCSVGRGDCDYDSHCQAGLRCGKDNCVKFSYDFPSSGYDCCYDPNVPKCGPGNADWACCSETNKCGEGLGDCDSDSQCEEGLRCGKDNCQEYGTFPSSGYDCCYKPKPATTQNPIQTCPTIVDDPDILWFDANHLNFGCIGLYRYPLSSNEAEDYCTSRGYRLVEIYDPTQQNFIEDLCTKDPPIDEYSGYWIGLKLIEGTGTWKWEDSGKMLASAGDFTAWGGDNPHMGKHDDPFAQARASQKYKWVDLHPGKGGAICQKI